MKCYFSVRAVNFGPFVYRREVTPPFGRKPSRVGDSIGTRFDAGEDALLKPNALRLVIGDIQENVRSFARLNTLRLPGGFDSREFTHPRSRGERSRGGPFASRKPNAVNHTLNHHRVPREPVSPHPAAGFDVRLEVPMMPSTLL
jgi:hypothetical protein